MANTTKSRDELLNVKEVMALYRVSRRTVYRWIKDGRIQGGKAGGRWLFTRKQVEDVLEG